MTERSGPLQGMRVVELSAIGPVPFAGMMLADMGADVVVVDRPVAPSRVRRGRELLPQRGRRSILADLKSDEGRATVLDLLARADVLLEGLRPGVIERLGIGPDVCLARNARLVVGRMTGWGQDGPLAQTAGHDINYISVAGVLDNLRRGDELPRPPINLIGDYGGGGMLLTVGVLAAYAHAQATGEGQVVDAAMVDGSALLMSIIHGYRAEGTWRRPPGTNFLDGGAPYYQTYRCADGGFLAVGAIESKFYAELIAGLGFSVEELPAQDDKAQWPSMREQFAARIAQRTRDEWVEIFEGTDACVSAVLSIDEAAAHPANVDREVFVEHHGHLQAAPAPRFSATPSSLGLPPPLPGEHTEEILRDWGISD